MHLIYLDESGNSGNNLADAQQPVFVLCALIVEEQRWHPLEMDLQSTIERLHPTGVPDGFEIHGNDLRNGHSFFHGVSVSDRIAFRDQWFAIAAKHGTRIVYRAIQKKRYAAWLLATFGPGVSINPHVAAFPLVAKVVNDYLRSLPGLPLGMFIADENREITVDVEKAIRLLRGSAGNIGLGQILEKGFFINSSTSLPLQLCDLCALSLRKHEEVKQGLTAAKAIDEKAYAMIEPIIHRGDEAFVDVMAWLTAEEKKKRPGNSS